MREKNISVDEFVCQCFDKYPFHEQAWLALESCLQTNEDNWQAYLRQLAHLLALAKTHLGRQLNLRSIVCRDLPSLQLSDMSAPFVDQQVDDLLAGPLAKKWRESGGVVALLDWDDTLCLRSQQAHPGRILRVIGQLRENGINPLICTARGAGVGALPEWLEQEVPVLYTYNMIPKAWVQLRLQESLGLRAVLVDDNPSELDLVFNEEDCLRVTPLLARSYTGLTTSIVNQCGGAIPAVMPGPLMLPVFLASEERQAVDQPEIRPAVSSKKNSVVCSSRASCCVLS